MPKKGNYALSFCFSLFRWLSLTTKTSETRLQLSLSLFGAVLDPTVKSKHQKFLSVAVCMNRTGLYTNQKEL